MHLARCAGVLAKVLSAGVLGIEAFSVDVEVDVRGGLPEYHVVGLPANAVKEGGVRVRAALEHSGLKLNARRVTVNLAPADIRKDGAAFDLPVSIGLLAAQEMVPRQALEGTMLLGELSLDGRIRRIAGSLPVAIHARAVGLPMLILPQDCADEAAAVSGIAVYGASNLPEVVAFLRGEGSLPQARFVQRPVARGENDLCEVRGLEAPRRALEVAAAGGHNLLLLGPPGSGKSMLARALPTVLPPLEEQEAIEVTAIYSAAGKLDGASLLSTRPFRAPHHDVSVAGLVGGGPVPRPGEISLAHHGVLFLDELLEFKRQVLEALRQPLEDRRITIVRARAALTFPSSFALIGAMNPCPCGYRGSSLRPCRCREDEVRRYLGRLSGPLLDRIDLHTEVPHVDYRALQTGREGEHSSHVRLRVEAARQIQRARLAATGRSSNAEMGPRHLREHCRLDAASDQHLEKCVQRFALSGRAVHRILRVARTCADLAQRKNIAPADVAEAIALRALDREMTGA